MTEKSIKYLERLKDKYKDYPDNYGMMDLASVEQLDERVRELKIYREQEKTQELIEAAITRFKVCVEKLTNPDRKISDEERTYCFATMDWARFTLDVVGENPAELEKELEKTVFAYMERAGLST